MTLYTLHTYTNLRYLTEFLMDREVCRHFWRKQSKHVFRHIYIYIYIHTHTHTQRWYVTSQINYKNYCTPIHAICDVSSCAWKETGFLSFFSLCLVKQGYSYAIALRICVLMSWLSIFLVPEECLQILNFQVLAYSYLMEMCNSAIRCAFPVL
jgi:hypothetical protein